VSARKSPHIGFEYSSPCKNRLAVEVASLGVAVRDESESETRMTPEKLKSRDGQVQWPDHEYILGSSHLITTATIFVTDNDSTLNIRPMPKVKKPEKVDEKQGNVECRWSVPLMLDMMVALATLV